MYIANRFTDYELLCAGGGEKLERWNDIILQRPDPQAIWPKPSQPGVWIEPHAIYIRSESGGGHWQKKRPIPSHWSVGYPLKNHPLEFIIEPTGFKHTGLFPEQSVNWDYCADRNQSAVAAGRKPRILNLFAYTGGATLACAAAGAAEVVHVDASKGMIARAKENIHASSLDQAYVRFIAEDCNRFVEREIRRNRTYDGIIMDPPAYGRGPSGELWRLEDALYELVDKCVSLLSDQALFFLLNSYTTGLSAAVMQDILSLSVKPKHGGKVVSADLGIPASNMDIVLPCGSVARWSNGESIGKH